MKNVLKRLEEKHINLFFGLSVLVVLLVVVFGTMADIEEYEVVDSEFGEEVVLFNQEIEKIEQSGEVGIEQKELMLGYLDTIGERNLLVLGNASERDEELYRLLKESSDLDKVTDAKIVEIVSKGYSKFSGKVHVNYVLGSVLVILSYMLVALMLSSLAGHLLSNWKYRQGILEMIQAYREEIEELRVNADYDETIKEDYIRHLEAQIENLEFRL